MSGFRRRVRDLRDGGVERVGLRSIGFRVQELWFRV